MVSSKEFFEKNGKIANQLPAYEIRPDQIRMVEAVDEAIKSNQNLIVEAGPGVGKSLAYLVPFINWAYHENRKVVISTYTKTLQSQLFVKDLPFLQRALEIDFRYSLCVGSENYICLRKAHTSSNVELFDTKTQRKEIEKIKKWLGETDTGLVSDMDFVPDKAVWDRFSRQSDLCLGRRCKFYDECFYKKAREKESESHILVANHSLLFTHIASGARVLPEFHALVIDEAHTLEDVATNHFGEAITSAGIERLLEEINNLGSFIRDDAQTSRLLSEVGIISSEFFKGAKERFGEEERIVGFDTDSFSVQDLAALLEELSGSLINLKDILKELGESEIVSAYAQKCRKIAQALLFIFSQKDERYVYWLKINKRKLGPNYSFHAAPIDVSDEIRKCLFEKISPIVLTSATLSLAGKKPDFSFIKKRLGLDDAIELALNSPFDYAKNVLMYLPKDIGDPNKDFDVFLRQVKEYIVKIYDIMKGRTFALFTSFEMLNAVSEGIQEERKDINMLKQGILPRYVLLDVFKRDKNSILMGTTTFWQGVDVPGKALECVIITKLPFSVPTDPITSGRIKAIQDEGRNAFTEYQVPQAVIMFKQGFGRLIRSHTDRGVIVVLDPRIQTRYYGREFINALPKCRKTSDIEEVKNFFESSASSEDTSAVVV